MGKGWLTGVGQASFYCNRLRLIQKAGRAEGERMAIPSHELKVSCYVLSSFTQKQLSLICPIGKSPKQQHNSKHKSIFLASSSLQPISSQYVKLFLIFSASFLHGFQVVFPAILPTQLHFSGALRYRLKHIGGKGEIISEFHFMMELNFLYGFISKIPWEK